MKPALAIDIGGTKTIAALVAAGEIFDQRETKTERGLGATDWCDSIAGLAAGWKGEYAHAGAAVTGMVADGLWTALNPLILPVKDRFPLRDELGKRLGTEVHCFNDAQAAAWGEYKFGAGAGKDIFFLTISTGIGGGAIVDGKLLVGTRGLAGSAGQLRFAANGTSQPIENLCAGLSIAQAAKTAGHELDASGVFAAARQGADWARAIIAASTGHVGNLISDLQMLFDPPAFVIGGGIGLADGFLDGLRLHFAGLPKDQRPEIRPAALGKHAGIIGVADLAEIQQAT